MVFTAGHLLMFPHTIFTFHCVLQFAFESLSPLINCSYCLLFTHSSFHISAVFTVFHLPTPNQTHPCLFFYTICRLFFLLLPLLLPFTHFPFHCFYCLLFTHFPSPLYYLHFTPFPSYCHYCLLFTHFPSHCL